MKRITLLVGIMALLGVVANGQSMGTTYKTALGVKFYPGAISLKYFNKPNKAIEALGYFYGDGVRFTGLYEIHGDIAGAEGLRWYVGPGGHIGFWNDTWKHSHPANDGGIIIGVDGVIGLDYKVKGAPVDFSLDWQPSFTFVGYNYFEGGWGGLGIRFTF